MNLKVFISYSTRNLPWVQRTRIAIASDDVEVFVAEYDARAGQDLRASVETAISNCDVVVVLWSKDAKESKWVRDEVAFAKGKQKQVIPVILDGDRELPEFIHGLKYIDFAQNPESALGDLKKLVDAKANAKARKVFGVLLTILGICVAAA